MATLISKLIHCNSCIGLTESMINVPICMMNKIMNFY